MLMTLTESFELDISTTTGLYELGADYKGKCAWKLVRAYFKIASGGEDVTPVLILKNSIGGYLGQWFAYDPTTGNAPISAGIDAGTVMIDSIPKEPPIAVPIDPLRTGAPTAFVHITIPPDLIVLPNQRLYLTFPGAQYTPPPGAAGDLAFEGPITVTTLLDSKDLIDAEAAAGGR